MIRIARDFGVLPHEVADRLPEEWLHTLHGFYRWESYMHSRPAPEPGGNVS